jgi:hypothetical protein
LLADLTLQLGLLGIVPALFPQPRKGVARPFAELAAPAVQHVRVHLKRPGDLGNAATRFQPLDGGQFHLTRERSARKSHDAILRLMKIVS